MPFVVSMSNRERPLAAGGSPFERTQGERGNLRHCNYAQEHLGGLSTRAA